MNKVVKAVISEVIVSKLRRKIGNVVWNIVSDSSVSCASAIWDRTSNQVSSDIKWLNKRVCHDLTASVNLKLWDTNSCFLINNGYPII